MSAVSRTPRTNLKWSTLEEWYACARLIEGRRYTALHHEQARLHVLSLPVATVYGCSDRATLDHCRSWLRHGPTDFSQPLRGRRANAPHTALIVAINNRIAQLDREADHASMGMGHNRVQRISHDPRAFAFEATPRRSASSSPSYPPMEDIQS